VKITAAVIWEAGAPFAIEEVDLDEPRDDEICVRVEAVGVCHTDDNARLGRLPVVFPLIGGHEGAGTVERTGAAVTRVRPGDRVLFTPDYCGRCQNCRLGRTPYCDSVVTMTFTGVRADGSPRAYKDGKPVRAAFFGQSSFATHALVTERNIVGVPQDAPLHYLAGLTCGVQTGAGAILSAMPVGPGRSTAVFGAGAVGIAAVMAAAASGADEIVAVDRVAHRLSLAAELGATHVIDTTGRDLADVSAEIMKVTGGGANSALDTTGNPGVLRAAVESLATLGTCGFVSGSGADITLSSAAVMTRGRSLRGVMGGDLAPAVLLPRLLDLHKRGRFPFDRLVRNYPFTEINKAIADSLSGQTIKPVLTFG
jgi:aryl-alcohol dehydrogenase